jgi:hypothetical protein
MHTMRFFSYIVRHDSGFAPNPFHGYCTLAACKPKIRQAAEFGDWVVGLSARGVRVIYAMKVDEKLDFATYWCDHRFRCKRPSKATRVQRLGDNIYEPLGNGQFRQLPSLHSKPPFGDEDPQSKRHDLSGKYVLVAKDFVYFGADGPPVPVELEFLRVGRGHRCHFEPEELQDLLVWVDGQRRGRLGNPADWRETNRCDEGRP